MSVKVGPPCCRACGTPIDGYDAAHKALHAVIERNAKRAASHWNYVADAEKGATRVLFASGRTVRIVNGALVVGWACKEAERIFGDEYSDSTK